MKERFLIGFFLRSVIPVVVAQVAARLFSVVLSGLAGRLGDDFFYIHNVQHQIVGWGQVIGAAGMVSAIALLSKKSSILLLNRIVLLIGMFTFCLGGAAFGFIILGGEDAFGLTEHPQGAIIYIAFGVISSVSYSVLLTLEGALVALGKQRMAALSALIILILALVFGYGIVSWTTYDVAEKFLLLGGLGPVLVIGASLFLYFSTVRGAFSEDSEDVSIRETLGPESTMALIRIVGPISYAFLMTTTPELRSFLSLYQPLMLIAYIVSVPVLSSVPIAIRESASDREWGVPAFVVGYLPTLLGFIFLMFFWEYLFDFVFKVGVDARYLSYPTYFFLACAIGQAGHLLGVPLRARGKGKTVTVIYLFSDVVFNTAGLWLIVSMKWFEVGSLIALVLSFSTFYTASLLVANFMIFGIRQNPFRRLSD